MSASKEFFKLSSTSHQTGRQKINRPWFNEECRKLIAVARKTRAEWGDDPLSMVKRSRWSLAETKKKTHY